MKIIDARSRLVVKANNDVSLVHSTFSCRAVPLERHNQDSALNGEVIVAHDSARKRNVLPGQADITATDFAVANETTGDELGGVNRSSETDPLRRQNHRRVDADHFTA